MTDLDYDQLAGRIDAWAKELGFAAVGIADIDLREHQGYLDAWLAKEHHGSMGYMARHGDMRSRPDLLHPGTASVISVRMDYLLPGSDSDGDAGNDYAGNKKALDACLADPSRAYVSRYALGRDYHKVVRGKLKQLVAQIDDWLTERNHHDFSARLFTDSAPVLEKALAEKAGLGWIGKNTLLLNESAGSWFFLGEILTNLPLKPHTAPPVNRCGTCAACIDVCPTDAIVAPYQLDARRCISYLTIEERGSIPTELRPLMGNRVFGCDDCQIVCPWNRYAAVAQEDDFKPRHGLDTAGLAALFRWSKDEFLHYTEGSAIRRAGYHGWLRNLAVALGNAAAAGEDSELISKTLTSRLGVSPLVDEHINWALEQVGE
ncbi:MAG: tRNA epoxyqueuosine(34) reductase QueG [Pseudomonadales bacterium]